MSYRTMLAILVNAIVLSMCFCPARTPENAATSAQVAGNAARILVDASPSGTSETLIVGPGRRSRLIVIRGDGTILVGPAEPGPPPPEPFLVECKVVPSLLSAGGQGRYTRCPHAATWMY